MVRTAASIAGYKTCRRYSSYSQQSPVTATGQSRRAISEMTTPCGRLCYALKVWSRDRC